MDCSFVQGESGEITEVIESDTQQNHEFECCLCDKRFTDTNSFEIHMNQDHVTIIEDNINHCNKFKMFKFSCPFCKKGFRRKISIDKHLRDKNFIEKLSSKRWRKPIQCETCGKIFSDKFEMSSHFARVHETNKPNKCEKCGKSFATQKLLNRHNISHGPKNHMCQVCEKTFLQKSQLESHMETHQQVKKYKCEICPKTFSHKRVLAAHILQHSTRNGKPFKCEECFKAYKWPEDLNTHRKAEHEGIFPYYCGFCRKGYLSSSNKKYHEKRCKLNKDAINFKPF